MKSTDVFPGKFLSAADLNGAEPVVTISHTKMEQVGDTMKLLVFFEGKEKALVCNKTNFNALEDITGEPDSDDWAGKRVKLVTVKVDFQGKRVPAVRVTEPPTNGAKAAPRRPEPVAAPDDSDIPF